MSSSWGFGCHSCLFTILFDRFALIVGHKFLLRNHFLYHAWDQGPFWNLSLSLFLVDRDSIRHCIILPKLSRFKCRNKMVLFGRNQLKPRVLRKLKPSLMKTDEVLYKWNTNCRDGLMLDCFAAQFVEVKLKWMTKITRGKVYPYLYIVSS